MNVYSNSQRNAALFLYIQLVVLGVHGVSGLAVVVRAMEVLDQEQGPVKEGLTVKAATLILRAATRTHARVSYVLCLCYSA